MSLYVFIQNAYNYNLPTLGYLVAISNIKHINAAVLDAHIIDQQLTEIA